MDSNRFKFLAEKHVHHNLSSDELEEFYQYLDKLDDNSLQSIFDNVESSTTPLLNKESIFQKIADEIDELEPSPIKVDRSIKPLYYKIVASACVVFMLSFFIYEYVDFDNFNTSANSEVDMRNNESSLGEASIRFADGKMMQIEDMTLDTILYQGLSLVKTNENELSILGSNPFDKSTHSSYDFQAKVGSILTLILPDKSLVTLNSGSSINLSSTYGISNRNLTLHGEGFFDVTHNNNLPFVVQVKDAKINVLGTVFNISGYPKDPSIKTTLISGSVRVSRNDDQVIIKPNQQAVIMPNKQISVSNNVSMDQVLAWKNGFFRFQDESIANVLDELSKWYPITAIDIKEGSQDKFTGSIKRTKRLEDVLSAISEVSNLKFNIEEGRIIVMK